MSTLLSISGPALSSPLEDRMEAASSLEIMETEEVVIILVTTRFIQSMVMSPGEDTAGSLHSHT